jgi:hypothetical protein
MNTSKRTRQRLARYIGLREHRERLGWGLHDLVAKLDGPALSERSVRRLEQGLPIRAENAHKVFNAISKAYPEALSRETCIVLDKS